MDSFPLLERLVQSPGNRHILKDAALALDSQSDDVLPHPLAIAPADLDQLLKPAGGLEESVGQVEREGRAISLLPGFEIVEEPADVGEMQIGVVSPNRRNSVRQFSMTFLGGSTIAGSPLFTPASALATIALRSIGCLLEEGIVKSGYSAKRPARCFEKGPALWTFLSFNTCPSTSEDCTSL
jgi:hypothetical protein